MLVLVTLGYVPGLQAAMRALINPVLILGAPLVLGTAIAAVLRRSRYAAIFLLGWLPLFLTRSRGLPIAEMTWIATLGFAAQAVASLTFGYLSDWWTRQGHSEAAVRRTMMIGGQLVAAGAFFLVNVWVVGTAVALYQDVPILSYFRNNLSFVVITGGVVLLVSPIVLAAAAYTVAIVPLCLAPVVAMSALLIWRHRGNLANLAAGRESRLGARRS